MPADAKIMAVATIPGETIARLRSLERLDESPFLRRKPLRLARGEAQSRTPSGDTGKLTNEEGGSGGGVGSKTRSGTSPFTVEQALPLWARSRARTSSEIGRNVQRVRKLPLLVTTPRAPNNHLSMTTATTAAATHHRPPASQQTSEGWRKGGGRGFSPVPKATDVDIAHSSRKFSPASKTKIRGVITPINVATEGMTLGGGSHGRTATAGDSGCVEPQRGTMAVFSPSSESVSSPAERRRDMGRQGGTSRSNSRQHRRCVNSRHHCRHSSSSASNATSSGDHINPSAPSATGEKIYAVSNIGKSGRGRQARDAIFVNPHADNRDGVEALLSVAGEGEGEGEGAASDPRVDRMERLQQALAQVKIETATSMKHYRSRMGDSGVTTAVPTTGQCILSESMGSPFLGTDVFSGGCDGAGGGHRASHSRGGRKICPQKQSPEDASSPR